MAVAAAAAVEAVAVAAAVEAVEGAAVEEVVPRRRELVVEEVEVPVASAELAEAAVA